MLSWGIIQDISKNTWESSKKNDLEQSLGMKPANNIPKDRKKFSAVKNSAQHSDGLINWPPIAN